MKRAARDFTSEAGGEKMEVESVKGKIYVFGGFHEKNIRALRRVDVYDPATDRWVRKVDMPKPITHRGAADLLAALTGE